VGGGGAGGCCGDVGFDEGSCVRSEGVVGLEGVGEAGLRAPCQGDVSGCGFLRDCGAEEIGGAERVGAGGFFGAVVVAVAVSVRLVRVGFAGIRPAPARGSGRWRHARCPLLQSGRGRAGRRWMEWRTSVESGLVPDFRFQIVEVGFRRRREIGRIGPIRRIHWRRAFGGCEASRGLHPLRKSCK